MSKQCSWLSIATNHLLGLPQTPVYAKSILRLRVRGTLPIVCFAINKRGADSQNGRVLLVLGRMVHKTTYGRVADLFCVYSLWGCLIDLGWCIISIR